jgi:hypothetical protein
MYKRAACGRRSRAAVTPARNTGAAIERAGFRIESSDRFMFAASRFRASIPHILGVARRP